MRFQILWVALFLVQTTVAPRGGAGLMNGEPQGRTATEKPTVPLIVEDNMILAVEAEDNLIEQGFTVVGIAPSLSGRLSSPNCTNPISPSSTFAWRAKAVGLRSPQNPWKRGGRDVSLPPRTPETIRSGRMRYPSRWLDEALLMNALGAALLKALQEGKNS